ncbi:lipoprotein-releasing ABC transporter permease subunit [Planctobacterium marinum]|uniref:lipoprotein-releasing ABC transporter permease subunit n=1 Tax=Planctobacterium marinum TaxID=1631968 RepID=UPI001E42F834|nr:lipoprotein-releasing ABC transporter permease subunit [Planctobacterium marinum]MCC2604200.1 lipoprotein-releasing ABC transporter permease subunit [Planctobacterium marinum]
MSLPASVFIGFRYSNSRKSNQFIAFINAFSVAGIALGLLALIVTSSVMNGFEQQLKDRILGLAPHFIVEGQLPDKARDALQPWIISDAPYSENEAVIQAQEGLKPVYIQGLDGSALKQAQQFQLNMVQGNLNTLVAGDYNIVVGRLLAMRLNLTVGDEVRVIIAGSSVYTPLGRIPAQRKFTISGIFDVGSELDDKVALINLTDLARLQRKKPDDITNTRLFMQDPFQYLSVREVLTQFDLQWTDWRERQGALFDAVKMEKNMMLIMLLLIVAVAAFNIVSALVMVVNEKQGDIAILRTQGMNRWQVMQIFLVNGIYNGVKGTLIGAVLGILITSQINNIIHWLNLPIVNFLPEGELPIVMDVTQISVLIGTSLGLCILASIIPAWRALKVNPANALRYE